MSRFESSNTTSVDVAVRISVWSCYFSQGTNCGERLALGKHLSTRVDEEKKCGTLLAIKMQDAYRIGGGEKR